MNKKQVIKINENKIKQIVIESVKRYLKESRMPVNENKMSFKDFVDSKNENSDDELSFRSFMNDKITRDDLEQCWDSFDDEEKEDYGSFKEYAKSRYFEYMFDIYEDDGMH